MTMTPRIYVSCLASYNSGILYGDWIDLEDTTEEQVRIDIQKILSSSPIKNAEEWAIHDHEDMGNIGEHANIADLVELADLVVEYGQPFLAYFEHYGSNFEDLEGQKERFECAFIGTTHDPRDFAWEQFQETNDLPDHVWGLLCKDMILSNFEFDHFFEPHRVHNGIGYVTEYNVFISSI